MRSRAKATTRRPTKPGKRRNRASDAAALPIGERTVRRAFPGLRVEEGCGALLVVAERYGNRWDQCVEVGGWAVSNEGKGKRQGAARIPRNGIRRVCQALGAVGHPIRAAILGKLLGGPATYRSLLRLTGLKAGPLYHHINQLRLAGLILPKQRDLYELTRGGRNLILVTMLMDPLVKDRRRRPVAAGD